MWWWSLQIAHQHDRRDQLGHDGLHGEALVVHRRDRPGQRQLQAVPVETAQAVNKCVKFER